jgi:hypothetical protein
MPDQTVPDVAPDRDAVTFALHVAPGEGVGWTTRAVVAPQAFVEVVAELLDSFRAMSEANGMLMTDQEIRDNCWGPMLAKLVDGQRPETGERFRDQALCFVAWTVFGDDVKAGDIVEVLVSDSRVATVSRRPRRLLKHNRFRLGRLPASVPDGVVA